MMTEISRAALLAALLPALAACPGIKKETEGAATTSTAKATASAAASATASTPPAPPPLPSPADLEKKTWSQGGTSLPLVATDLSKTCLMKGVTLMLPEKASLKPLMDTRGCVIRAWGGEEGPYMFVIDDELGKLPDKPTKKIKRFFEETAQSWLAESDDPKIGFVGELKRDGAHHYACKAVSNGKEHGDEIVRGMIELCSTMTVPAS